MGLIDLTTTVELLKKGTPVALPTETVYGLACPISSKTGLQKIFSLKKRPLNDPLIVHCSSLKMALKCLKNPHPDFSKLGETFWPGPLTLINEKNSEVISDLISSSLPSVAIRIPNSPLFRQVIDLLGAPLAAPSANLFKKVSPTTAQHVLSTLPGVDVLDGGACTIGIESTIYDPFTKKILRTGNVTHKQIQDCINKNVTYEERENTPGSENEHYQPETTVWVFESKEKLKNIHLEHIEIKLSEDPQEAALNLYSQLRSADQKSKFIFIYFSPSWNHESWFGVKNRLKKASTKWIT